jgi:hypothetical protein
MSFSRGGEHLRPGRDRGRCDGLALMRRIVGMRHASGVHHLDEDVAALVVHGTGHVLPFGDVSLSVDAGCGEVALSVVGGLRAFGHDQPDLGALGIILGGQVSRRAVGPGAAASHRRHHQAVWQGVASDADGRE